MRFYEFFTLEPDATLKDLKRAYAKKIKTCRPEDDPALFMTIRGMYEEGCAHFEGRDESIPVANATVSELSVELNPQADSVKPNWRPPVENTPPASVSLFAQLKAHYDDFEARLDIAKWQSFFTTFSFETYALFPEVFDSFSTTHHVYTREIAFFLLKRFDTLSPETTEKLQYIASAPKVLDTFEASDEVGMALFIDLYLSAVGFEIDIDLSRLTTLKTIIAVHPALHYLAVSHCIEKGCASILEGVGDRAYKRQHNMLGIESQLADEMNKPNRAYDLSKEQLRTVENDANSLAAYWFKRRLIADGQVASGPERSSACCFNLYNIDGRKLKRLQEEGIEKFVEKCGRDDRMSTTIVFGVLGLMAIALLLSILGVAIGLGILIFVFLFMVFLKVKARIRGERV